MSAFPTLHQIAAELMRGNEPWVYRWSSRKETGPLEENLWVMRATFDTLSTNEVLY